MQVLDLPVSCSKTAKVVLALPVLEEGEIPKCRKLDFATFSVPRYEMDPHRKIFHR